MDDVRFYVRMKGVEYGPIERPTLVTWVQEGKFGPDDEVWYCRLGKWEWIVAGHLAEFQDLFTDMTQEHREVGEALEEAKRIRKSDLDAGRTPTRLLAVGGGKGGTGKTSISAAVALSLASLERSVVLVDADLGGANIHTCLGMCEADVNLSQFFGEGKKELVDMLIQTTTPGLRLVGGTGGVLGLANPKYSQKLKFINRLRKLQADYVVMDLGAGTTFDILDLFLAADLGIIVTCPDPFSLQNGFNFLKTCTWRRLTRDFGHDPTIAPILEEARKSNYRRPLVQLLNERLTDDGSSVEAVKESLRQFTPGLIVNMVMNRGEAREGLVIKSAAGELLGIEVDYLGYVAFDRDVRAALRQMQPFVVAYPHSEAAGCILDIVVRRLLNAPRLRGFFDKRKMRKRLRKVSRPVTSVQQANETAIYDGHAPQS